MRHARTRIIIDGAVSLLDQSALEVLGWWKIIAGNILALIAMTAYFIRSHRGLRIKLAERWAMLDSEGEEMGDAPAPTPKRHPERLHF